jgi:hypothetical protein
MPAEQERHRANNPGISLHIRRSCLRCLRWTGGIVHVVGRLINCKTQALSRDLAMWWRMLRVLAIATGVVVGAVVCGLPTMFYLAGIALSGDGDFVLAFAIAALVGLLGGIVGGVFVRLYLGPPRAR